MGLRKMLGLGGQHIYVKGNEGRMPSLDGVKTVQDLEAVFEARKIIAGEPMGTNDNIKQSPPYECIGFMGRIFGHKFSDIERYFDDCARCGMPKGGWRNQKSSPK